MFNSRYVRVLSSRERNGERVEEQEREKEEGNKSGAEEERDT